MICECVVIFLDNLISVDEADVTRVEIRSMDRLNLFSDCSSSSHVNSFTVTNTQMHLTLMEGSTLSILLLASARLSVSAPFMISCLKSSVA